MTVGLFRIPRCESSSSIDYASLHGGTRVFQLSGCSKIFNAVLCTRLYMSVFAIQYPASLCGRWMRNRILNCCGLSVWGQLEFLYDFGVAVFTSRRCV